jgi:multidrug efflux pump subunit AcrA (membrane-fusion protein)
VRYRNLYEQNATSRMEYDRASLAYRTSCNDYKALLNRYRNTQTSLADNLRNARTQYELDAETQSDYQVRSRIDGKVYELYREEGELVKRGEPVALLGDPSGVYLKLGIDELDIHKVQRGQPVLVKLDSYPDRVFRAVVEKIYPMLNARDRTFAADARFTDSLPGTYAGLTAEANIVIRQSPRALSIPRAYLWAPTAWPWNATAKCKPCASARRRKHGIRGSTRRPRHHGRAGEEIDDYMIA